MGMIEPDNGTGVVGPRARASGAQIGVSSTGSSDTVMRGIVGAVVIVQAFWDFS